jgi:hypothetical protein
LFSYFFFLIIQIELPEAQAKIIEALSVIEQASQSKENFVAQIDLQNLKKELSTDISVSNNLFFPETFKLFSYFFFLIIRKSLQLLCNIHRCF